MWHPGISCSFYFYSRMRQSFITGCKVSALFIALPALIQTASKLKIDPIKTCLKIIEKWVRSTIQLTIYAAFPCVLYCWAFQRGISPSANLYTASCLIACVLGYLFETPSRHIQLLGYLAPKAFETFAGVLERERHYRPKSWHTKAIVLLAWTIIAIYNLRAFYKRRRQRKQAKMEN